MLEYEAVLTREEHLAVIGLSPTEVNQVLDALAAVITPVTLRFLWRPTLKDANDEMVLETAANGGANWLVTFNVRHFAAAAVHFGIRVMLPRDAWKEYRRHEEK